MRKKTPKEIFEQWCRIFDYIEEKDWAHGAPSAEINERHCEFLSKLKDVAWKYIDNIYKLAGVNRIYERSADKSNDIWEHYKATKAEYAK